MVDQEKVRQKVQFIRNVLAKLHKLNSLSFEDFMNGPFYLDASLHELQVAIEAMIDICNHIIAREGWGLLKTYQDGFKLLTENGILDPTMLDTYTKMVKFRNRVVHIYDEVQPEEIYKILQNHLSDFEGFVSAIVKKYFSA